MTNAKDIIKDARTIVIKIGSVLVCNPEIRDTHTPRTPWFQSLARDIKALQEQDKNIILVSSGGIALGRDLLDIPKDQSPDDIPLELRQAASAIGQPLLFQEYSKAFSAQDLKAAQILLTVPEIETQKPRSNAIATMKTLLDNKVISIINENDTVATREIKFGDNDQLAARVAEMIQADLLILLSTVDGLYTGDPGIDKTAQHIPSVKNIAEIEHYAGDSSSALSTGGMKSKILAARTAVENNINVILANGRSEGCLGELTSNLEQKNTTFTIA